jgi:hypothetical protein
MPISVFRRRRARGAWLMGGFAVAAAGAALAWLVDPRRRSALGARAQHALHDAEHFAAVGARDLGQRARGLAHETRARLTPEHPADDVLALRVRARLGHVTSHPRAIRVTARDGGVELSGPVFRAEHDQVVRGVRGVRGVRSVEDRLEPHDVADVRPLEGAGPRRLPPTSVLPRRSPGYRLVAGAAGAFLVGRALLAGGRGRLPAGLAGATLLGKVLSRAGGGAAWRARAASDRPRPAAPRRARREDRAAGAEPSRAGAREAGGWSAPRGPRRVPEVVEVKSPAELEPGVVSASPDPLRPGRVDRRDLRGRASRSAPFTMRDDDDEDAGFDDLAPHTGFSAPDEGASVREGDLGAVMPREDLGEGGDSGGRGR